MQAGALSEEDSSPAANSQPVGVPGAQHLPTNLDHQSFDAFPSAAPAQVCFALLHGTPTGHCMLCHVAIYKLCALHSAALGGNRLFCVTLCFGILLLARLL